MQDILKNLFGASTPSLPAGFSFLIWILFLWSIIWKGIALWHSSKTEEKYWFIALLVINSAGILEIVYLYFFSKKKLKPKTTQVQELIEFVKPNK